MPLFYFLLAHILGFCSHITFLFVVIKINVLFNNNFHIYIYIYFFFAEFTNTNKWKLHGQWEKKVTRGGRGPRGIEKGQMIFKLFYNGPTWGFCTPILKFWQQFDSDDVQLWRIFLGFWESCQWLFWAFGFHHRGPFIFLVLRFWLWFNCDDTGDVTKVIAAPPENERPAFKNYRRSDRYFEAICSFHSCKTTCPPSGTISTPSLATLPHSQTSCAPKNCFSFGKKW